MKNITTYISLILLIVCSFLYPFWWKDGYLDTLYLKISVAVAVYGGLIANIVYLYIYWKDNK